MMESFRHSIDYKYPRAVEFSGKKSKESMGENSYRHLVLNNHK